MGQKMAEADEAAALRAKLAEMHEAKARVEAEKAEAERKLEIEKKLVEQDNEEEKHLGQYLTNTGMSRHEYSERRRDARQVMQRDLEQLEARKRAVDAAFREVGGDVVGAAMIENTKSVDDVRNRFEDMVRSIEKALGAALMRVQKEETRRTAVLKSTASKIVQEEDEIDALIAKVKACIEAEQEKDNIGTLNRQERSCHCCYVSPCL